ncbi:hypothetical protein BaRGS_00037247 [Batillaria attramentaria]|uniref:G-protein coupled receptors family 1 profile domain-containing protein n=1 Tax=Batillaria attramentaria TaxID=370345 RepID=A0ABD0J999_9CAEN
MTNQTAEHQTYFTVDTMIPTTLAPTPSSATTTSPNNQLQNFHTDFITPNVSVSTPWNDDVTSATSDDVTVAYSQHVTTEDVPIAYFGNDEVLLQFVEFQVALWIDYVYVPVCAGFGIIGSLLSLCVLLSPRMAHSSTCIYMAALAVSDCLIQIVNILFLVRKFHGHEVLMRGTCGLVFFLLFPLKAVSWSTPKRACKVVTVVFLLTALLESHHLVIRDMVWNDYLQVELCVPVGELEQFYVSRVWPWVDGAIYCFGPLASLVVLNMLIARQMKASRRFRRTSTRSCDGRGAGSQGDHSRQVTTMLLFVTFTFLVLVSPVAVTLVLERYVWMPSSLHQRAVHHLVRTVINNLGYTNHAVNFLLYNLSGKRFRQEFLRIFCSLLVRRGRKRAREANEQTTIANSRSRSSSISLSAKTSTYSLHEDSFTSSVSGTYVTRI